MSFTGQALLKAKFIPSFKYSPFEIRLIVKSNLEIGNVLIVNNLKKPLNSEQDNFFMIPKVFNYASK